MLSLKFHSTTNCVTVCAMLCTFSQSPPKLVEKITVRTYCPTGVLCVFPPNKCSLNAPLVGVAVMILDQLRQLMIHSTNHIAGFLPPTSIVTRSRDSGVIPFNPSCCAFELIECLMSSVCGVSANQVNKTVKI
ncbi:MAG: hypothetical protein CM15mV21_1360 [Eurybiavirus sp.]|nr:MAG: hypothetical protein CM15mV21_1360 [Eurybiavirus sp.]